MPEHEIERRALIVFEHEGQTQRLPCPDLDTAGRQIETLIRIGVVQHESDVRVDLQKRYVTAWERDIQ